MTFFHFSLSGQRLCLVLLFTINCLAGVLAQSTIVVTDLGGNSFKVGTSGLDNDDLVFYRFSDGYEMTAIKTSTNPQATVQRSFKLANTKVSGFVAKKGGGLNLATGDVSSSTCPSCTIPSIGLLSGEFVRLRTPSWSPFVDPGHPDVLMDTKTTPTCLTPGTPWFILPITMKAHGPNDYAIVTVPTGMRIQGGLVKGTWTPVNVGSNTYPVADGDVQSFQYNAGNSFRINLTASYNNEFNVYLLVSSSTLVGEASIFCVQMYNSAGVVIGGSSCNRLMTQVNPHDPNHLTAFKSSMCWYHMNNDPMRYRVDFQNIGTGDAQSVIVNVQIDNDILVASPLINVLSSHPMSPPNTSTPGSLGFQFNNIYLKGLNQSPQPALDDTKGWVEFSLAVNPCLPQQSFTTHADITFIGTNGMAAPPLGTNTTTQFVAYDNNCHPEPECGTSTGKLGKIEFTQITATKCYPTLFKDNLVVETPAPAENIKMTLIITDLTGRTCMTRTYELEQDVAFLDNLDTSTLPSGMYMVQIWQGLKMEKFKVIKE